jgi:pyruvate/2-oxoacid:ferredoxin oxidoreductase beta subunit
LKRFLVEEGIGKDPQFKNLPILMVTAVKDYTGIDFKEAAGDETWLPVEEYLKIQGRFKHLLNQPEEIKKIQDIAELISPNTD